MAKVETSRIQKNNFLKATSFTDVLNLGKHNSARDVLNRLNEFSKDGYIDASGVKALTAKYGEAWNPAHYNLKAASQGYQVSDFCDAICAKFMKTNPDYDFEHKYGADAKNSVEEFIVDLGNAYIVKDGKIHYLFQRVATEQKHSFKDDWLSQ